MMYAGRTATAPGLGPYYLISWQFDIHYDMMYAVNCDLLHDDSKQIGSQDLETESQCFVMQTSGLFIATLVVFIRFPFFKS